MASGNTGTPRPPESSGLRFDELDGLTVGAGVADVVGPADAIAVGEVVIVGPGVGVADGASDDEGLGVGFGVGLGVGFGVGLGTGARIVYVAHDCTSVRMQILCLPARVCPYSGVIVNVTLHEGGFSPRIP